MNELTFNDYEVKAMETAVYPDGVVFNADDVKVDIGLWYAAMGMLGEAGEFANHLKKVLRDHNGNMSAEDEAAIVDELGDVLWYLAAVSGELGYSLDEIAKRNLAKLSDRKARDVIKGSGNTR